MSASPIAHVLCLDNFDSFVFNLVDEFARRGCRVETWRNDTPVDTLLEVLDALPAPKLLLVSPGPGRPEDAGCAVELIRRSLGTVPTFGVCLGHQAIVTALGGEVGLAGEVVHGRSSRIRHRGRGLFHGCPDPMTVARYHSLAANRVPDGLEVTAHLDGHHALPMAVESEELGLAGVQFHPESILTLHGGGIIENVIRSAR